FDADLFAWARDTDAAIEALLRRAGEVPLYVVGHSLGAQLPGLLRHRGRIAGLVSIAAGSGYWRDNAPRLTRSVLYFWHVRVAPADVAARRIGHFGFFRDAFRPTLWARTAGWLSEFDLAKETMT